MSHSVERRLNTFLMFSLKLRFRKRLHFDTSTAYDKWCLLQEFANDRLEPVIPSVVGLVLNHGFRLFRIS